MTTPAGTASPSLALTQGTEIANSVTSAVTSNTFVFFAAFDGTDNGSNPLLDGSGDTQATAVAQLFSQVLPTGLPSGNIGGKYEPGVGTPNTIPGSEGFNPNALNAQVLAAAQDAYNQFAAQATAWLAEPGHAGGSLTSMITSFSRGGASAAIFAQMLYEKGLVNAEGTVLIPPGTVGAVSAALILDPVLTEVSGNMDFPPTVENLTIVRAANEYRDLYTAPTYAGESNADIITVQGNHGDVGDLYDTAPSSDVTSPLGGIYLDAYTQFFKNAGISNIAAVPSGLQYNPASGNPVIIHSEALSAAQILATGRFWDASTYNPNNTLTGARETTDYGAPALASGGGTSFKAYNGTVVLGGDGATSSTQQSSTNTYAVLPGSEGVSIEGFSDTIAVGDNASLTFTSDSLVTGTTNTLQGSPNVVSLGNNATLAVIGWDTNIIGGNDSITLAAGDAATTISGANNDITLGVGASFTADSLANLSTDTITYDISGGGSFTIDAGTASYNSTTITNSGTQSVPLVYGDPIDLGTLTFDTTTGTDSFTLTDGEVISLSGITSDTITAAAAGTSTLQTLIDYLGDLGDTFSVSALDALNTAFLYPSGLPSEGTTLDFGSGANVPVTQTEFNAFTDIDGTGGTIKAATSGTFDLATAPVASGTHVDLEATDWGGTTLIGDSENGQSLTASLYGNDTLTAANGTDDSLTAGYGVDTITGGTGGDTFITLDGLASGTNIIGHDTGNALVASGDISRASISGIQALQIDSNLTLTASQFNSFGTITTPLSYDPPATISTSGGGTYDLNGISLNSGIDVPTPITIADDADTTITGYTSAVSGEALADFTASGNGNDTLTAYAGALSATGNGNDTLTLGNGGGTITTSGGGNDTITTGSGVTSITVTGAGTNTITGGNGAGDSITVSNGTDTATAGNGAGDSFTATTGGNTLIAGNGAGDTFTAQGGDNVMQAGDGGSTFNIYDDDNTATATGGSNTFNLQGASGLTDVSGTTIDLAGSVISGGSGGANTLNAAGGTTLIMSDDDGSISNIQAVTGMTTLDINADQMAPLTSLSFDGAFGAMLNAETSGTYDLAAIDSADTLQMVDASTGGPVTLINNDAAGAEVIGSNSGDTLAVGSGDGDTIEALAGSGNTITAGAGNDDTIEAFGGGNTITASGDDAHVTLGSSTGATLAGDDAHVTVIGAGDTIALQGTDAAATDVVGNGNTFVVGGGGSEASASISGKNDIYKFVSDFGQDTVTISGGSTPDGHIVFGSGVTDQNLWFAQSGNDLQIGLMGTDETVTVHNWFSGAGHEADDVILSNGSQLTNAQVSGLVSAMATYQAANPSFDPTSVSSLPSDTTLQAAVTTAWASEVTIADTAANVAAELDYLETLAAAGHLASITITNSSTPLPITVGQLTSDATALGLISGSYSLAVFGVTAANAATVAGDAHVTSVSVTDSAANVTANLSALQGVETSGELGSILLTDPAPPTLTVTETQLGSDAGALSKITGSYDLSVTNVLAADAASVAAEAHVTSVNVSDTAANVTTNIASLETLATDGTLASIALTGTPALTFNAATAAANADALSLLTGTFTLTVSDSAANVAANIDALGTLAAIGALTAVTFTDSGTPTLSITGTQAQNDSAIFSVITSPFAVTLTSDTFATFTSNGDTVSLTGSDNDIGLEGTGSSISDWAGGNSITLGNSDTATLYASGSTVTAAGNDVTVNDYGTTGGNTTILNGDSGLALLCATGSSVVMNGNEDTAYLYADSETATASGTDGTVNIETSDNTVNVTGTGNEVNDHGSGGNTITLSGNNDTADLHSTGETITLSGTDDSVNDWAGDNAITLSATDTATLYGVGSTVTVLGSGDSTVDDYGASGGNTTTLNGDSGLAILCATGSSVVMNGSEDTAYLYADSETATASGTDGTVNIETSDNTVNVTGTGNEVNDHGSGGNTITLSGNNDTADLHSTGETITLSGTDDSVNDWAGDNTITLGASDTATLYGVGSTVTVLGSGDSTVNDYGASGGNTTTLNGNSGVAILCATGSSVVMNGNEDTAYLYANSETATASGYNTIVNFNGGVSADTADLLGIGDTAVDFGVSNTITLSGSFNTAVISNTGTDTLTIGGTSNVGNILSGTTGTQAITISGASALLEFGGATADQITFDSGAVGKILLESAASFTGTVAGLDSDDSIDLGNFLFSGSPTISSVTGTGDTGTATTITITDGTTSTQMALINQFANQYAVSSSAYTLAADGTGGSAGTLFQLAAGH